MDELVRTKRQLIELYLFSHHFREVRCRDEINLYYSMKLRDEVYTLTIEREWLDIMSDKKTAERLDQLKVVPFLLESKAAWIGVTTTGQRL